VTRDTGRRVRTLANCAGDDLQNIQDSVGRGNDTNARVRFPRGYLETAAIIRSRLPRLGPDTLRRNISYALMMNDVFRWLASRTDLSGTAFGMVVKEAICLLGSICESWTKYATRGHASNRGFRARTTKLVQLSIIDPTLKDELDWIWEIRSREHLFEVTTREDALYWRHDYSRAVQAFDQFREALKAKFG